MKLSGGSLIILAICTSIIITPLLFWPKAYNPYELPKFIFVACFFWLLAVSQFIVILKEKVDLGKARISDNLTKLIIIFALWVFFTDLLGIDIRTSILGSPYRHQGFILMATGVILYFLTRVGLARNSKNQKFFFGAVILSNLILAIITIWQGIQYFFLGNLSIPNYHGRMIATMGSPIFLGGYLAITLPFIVLLRPGKTSRAKIWGGLFKLLAIVLNGIALYLADSRAAILTVIVIWGGFLGYRLLSKFVLERFKRKYLVIVLFVSLLFIILIFFSQGFTSLLNYLESENCKRSSNPIDRSRNILYCLVLPDIENQRYSKNEALNGVLMLLSRGSIWENRGLIWIEGLNTFNQRRLLGYGQENLELVFDKQTHMSIDNAHNIFLEILISSGVIGLILFILILFLTIKRAPLVIKLALLAYIVRAQFNPLSVSEIMMFWFLVGMS